MTKMINLEEVKKSAKKYNNKINKVFNTFPRGITNKRKNKFLFCLDKLKTIFIRNKNNPRKKYNNVKQLRNIIKEIPLLLDELKIIFSMKNVDIKNMDTVISDIIYKSYNDIEKKFSNKSFYEQNVKAFVYVVNYLCNILNKTNIKHLDNYVIKHMIEQFKELFIDSEVLINNYINKIYNDEFLLIYKTSHQDNFNMWMATRQSLYLPGSPFCFIDKEFDGACISSLRVSIENRIRDGFGCFGLIEVKNENFKPLDLSIIFECIETYNADIEYAVPFKNIVRIYSWTNIYMHGGLMAYSWLLHIVLYYLHGLFDGFDVKNNKNNFNIYNGIRIKRGIVYNIWNDIEKKFNENDPNKRYKLICCESEDKLKAVLV